MNVNPINYELTFEPDLKKFTFDGTESISVNCKKSTNTITMNCSELKIKSCKVKSAGKFIKSTPKINEKKEELQIKLGEKIKGKVTINLEFFLYCIQPVCCAIELTKIKEAQDPA